MKKYSIILYLLACILLHSHTPLNTPKISINRYDAMNAIAKSINNGKRYEKSKSRITIPKIKLMAKEITLIKSATDKFIIIS